jgi:RsiW-degrading membrane proteinase PrsW (M82 family)
MRNAWKGLIIGALTGAAVGLGVEALEDSTRLA